jgi:hypothetical protein
MKNSISFAAWLVRHALVLLLAVSLTGCLEEKKDEEDSPTEQPTNEPPPPPPPTNTAPEISGTPEPGAQAGKMYSFTPQAADADDDFLEFTIEGKPTWTSFNTETGAMSGTPTDSDVGDTADITISVTDGRDTRSVGPFKIKVKPRDVPPAPNSPPTISGVPANAVTINQAYSFQPSASDPDRDTLRFTISGRPSWASFSTSTGRLSGTPTSAAIGTYSNIVISVNDGEVSVALPAFAIQVRDVPNQAPTITGAPPTSVTAGTAYSFTPSGRDADNNPLTYSIANKPLWATFSTSTGRLNGTPATGNVGNYANIMISVSDGRASASLPAFAINVQEPPNRAPTINGSPPTSVTAGTAYTFTPSATDADNDTLGYTIQNKPTWAAFDTATGRLSGTPTSQNVGPFGNIVITVSDGEANASLAAFTITVNAAANRAPTISGTPPTSVQVGTAYNFQPTGADADGDTLSYTIQNKPTWATFSTSTGRLSGTPPTGSAGVYGSIVISVTDTKDTVALQAFSITVTAPPTNGSASLSWTPPTQNTDGSTIANLAGFRIQYGTSATALTQTIQVANPGVASYVVTGLGSGTWYFAVKAYSSSGAESANSNVATKTIP